jgi:hypothetical protein
VDLAGKLAAFAKTMTAAERSNFKILLSMAAGGLAGNGKLPSADLRAEAFAVAVNSLASLEPHHRRIPPNGIVYRGRPDFLSDIILKDLQAESARLRPTAFRFDSHFVVSGAPLAREIGFSEQLIGSIQECAGPVIPTAKANYLYYDEEGLGIDPHIDNPDFSLNAILMLEHTFVANPSALVLYPSGAQVQRVVLKPGEMIVIYADSTTHARERMGRGERLRIAAFGFHPVR